MQAIEPGKGGLIRCADLWGASALREDDPDLEVFDDVLYLPYRHEGRWGLFDGHGALIRAATDWRGPQNQTIDQIPEIPDDAGPAAQADDAELIYAGRFNPHFGHFLVETLPRLWWLARRDRRGRKLLMHGDGDPAGWFARGFAAGIWRALGLAPADLAVFARPTRLRRVIVPAPSLQQQSFVHEVFGLLCRNIGGAMLRDADLTPSPTPVYLSKSRLDLGVHVFANEEALEARLGASRIEIVHPETLTLAEQVRLFETRPAILGTTGSAFHASIFARATPRQITLSPHREINSNFALFDHVSGNRTEHYHQPGTADLGPSERHHARHLLPDPTGAADALLRLLDEGIGSPAEPARSTAMSMVARALATLRRRW